MNWGILMMMQKSKIAALILWGLSLSSQLFAESPYAKLVNEDVLFSQRAEGFNKATDARHAYMDKVKSGTLNPQEKLYALGQVGRLDLYRGMMAPGVSEEIQVKVFRECKEDLSLIENTDTQVYYYYYLSCIANLGKRVGFIEKLSLAREMKSIKPKALKLLETQVIYEAGGIARVIAGVSSNRQASIVGLYDVDLALEYSEKALDTEKVVLPPFDEELGGRDFLDNLYYRALSLLAKAIESKDDQYSLQAKEVIQSSLKDLSSRLESFTMERKPERDYYETLVQRVLNDIDACQLKWKCLKDRDY